MKVKYLVSFLFVPSFVNENIIGFTNKHVLILSCFNLPLSMCGISVNRFNDMRKNKVKCFSFVSIKILNIIFENIDTDMLNIVNYIG